MYSDKSLFTWHWIRLSCHQSKQQDIPSQINGFTEFLIAGMKGCRPAKISILYEYFHLSNKIALVRHNILVNWKNVKPINKFSLSINILLLELQPYKLKGICNFTFDCILVLLQF